MTVNQKAALYACLQSSMSKTIDEWTMNRLIAYLLFEERMDVFARLAGLGAKQELTYADCRKALIEIEGPACEAQA